ncbi:hypothetical protein Slin15195_G002150 [Septoria linicola]|uniref:Uncharacterized protein n=1 Tax=Septoria linicola TaxID=215465 RepID=A0A9Q9AJ66_9PEZI|nr:hypothetical protein Slin14017_G002180 [Septoria linicola]USW46896.1 hypothetical protein Slin15195_G002150 [Septoria linicola]
MSIYSSAYDPTGLFTTSAITDYEGFYGTGDQSDQIITQSYSTRTISFTKEWYMAYGQGGAKPPCCSTCLMSAGTIEFFWWPDLASSTSTALQEGYTAVNGESATITAVGKNGFVFTSPSVYMAFSSLYATNLCGTVGEAWENTTIGFHPSEISTVNTFITTSESYTTFTYSGSVETALANILGTRLPPSPINCADLAQNCSSISGYVYFPDDPQNNVNGALSRDPCHPVLAIPTALIEMQKAWKDANCQAYDGYGAYDPPIALTPAAYAAQPTLPAQPGMTSLPDAIPQTATYSALPLEDLTSTFSSTGSTPSRPAAEASRVAVIPALVADDTSSSVDNAGSETTASLDRVPGTAGGSIESTTASSGNAAGYIASALGSTGLPDSV